MIRSNIANDGAGPSNSNINAISEEPKIVFGTGNNLNFPGFIAHCVSSDFQMSKRVARQIRDSYPEL